MNVKFINEQMDILEEELKRAEMSEGFLVEMRRYSGEDRVISFQDYMEYIKGLPVTDKMMSQIKELDDLTDGFETGELVVISAPTGMGKTSMLATLIKNFANQKIGSLLFTFEVSAQKFINKYGEDVPVAYLPKVIKDKSLDWIESKIIEAKVKYNIQAIFIDHLHYLIDMFKLRNPSLEIGQIVRELKLLAIKYNIAVFLVAHLAKTTMEERINLDSIRDSSFVAQEADFVLLMWRDTQERTKKDYESRKAIEYLTTTTLAVDKNRRSGKLGDVKLIMVNNLFEKFNEQLDYGQDIASTI